MSTTTRPYQLVFHNHIAAEFVRDNGMEGSTFRPIADRSYGTVGTARARMANLLSEQYDPRLPLVAQPVVQLYGPDGFYEAWTMLPGWGVVNCDRLTVWLLAYAAWLLSGRPETVAA